MKPKKLYLIDISSLFFRSYYAIDPKMKDEKGRPTNAIYGTLKMLSQLGTKAEIDYIVACFDSKQPSFRKNLYTEYKANRKEMPEDLEAQIPFLKLMMDRLKIAVWQKPGFEADDLIASLALKAKKNKFNTYIVSGDKDFAQIVDSKIFLYDTMKDRIYDPSGVEAKWGLPPSQMRDYLSLVGDSSDNVPGVRGIGPKGAIKLLKDYKDLKGIYKQSDSIKGSLQTKLLENKEMAFLSQKLVTLKTDLTWDKTLTEAKYQKISCFSPPDQQALREFLQDLSFKSFLKSFFTIKSQSPQPLKQGWIDKPSTKPTKPLFKSLAPSLKLKLLNLEEFKKNLLPYASVTIGTYQDKIYLLHKKNITLVSAKELSRHSDFLDQKWLRYLGHDLKSYWKTLGLKNPVAEWDSLIAGHLLHSLSEPCFRTVLKKELNIDEQETLSLNQSLYLEEQLKNKQHSRLQEEGMLELFTHIELPLIYVLYQMEKQGFLLDLKELKKQSESLATDLKNLKFNIYKLSGEEFNLSSPKQLATVLFDKLNLPRGRKTKTGYSTDSQELLKIKQLHPILPLLLEYRELFKLKSAYTDNLISLRDDSTGRVYTEFKQTIASTGRLSSVNPNLQNIPIRTQRGQLIRKVFIADKNKQLICADYSQLELRILADITGDRNLKKAFQEDLDIHAITASELFNKALKDVTFELRRIGKLVNFGIAYGQGVYGLSEALAIPRTESKEIIDNYFKKFKKVKEYIEAVKQDLPKKGYVKTLYGRKRFFNKEDLKSPRQKAMIERAAINAPLQGTASDLVKKAMIELSESLNIPILSQVHDELLFESPKNHIETNLKEIVALMEQNTVLKTPLKVNAYYGKNWFIAHG